MFKSYSEVVEDFVNDFVSPVKFSFENFDLTQTIPMYEDLTILESEEVGKYSSLLRGFSTFLTQERTKALASKEFFQDELENAESEAIMRFCLENPKATATAIKNSAVNSPSYLAAKNQLVGAKLLLESIDSNILAIEKTIATASREISRRIGLNGKYRDEAY